MNLAPPNTGEAEPPGASAQALVEWLLAKDAGQRCTAAQALDHPSAGEGSCVFLDVCRRF